ncbi:MAG: M28 family peptidase [Vicinamibacterales bacterium]
MRGRTILVVFVAALAAGGVVGAQMTPWLQWTLLPKSQVAEIVGEASGENAWKMIMETGGYDKDRAPEEFSGLFYETQFYLDTVKRYGLAGAEVVSFPGGQTWDAVKGELWEVTPIRQKLASYLDMAAMLATGSTTGEASGQLVWVGRGMPDDYAGKNLAGKIAVTEGSAGMVHQTACLDRGALGVISIQGTRPLFDPMQIGWASVRGTPDKPAKFAFQIPPREGEFLKRRLLAGETITVSAKVETAMRPYTIQDIVWHIPGTDPAAGEIIFSAHLFEGYVKMGGNDNISGSAVVVEIGRTLNTLIDEGRLPRPRRTIRFLIGPEFSGTGPWVKANKALMEQTLCNINLDMVGLLLSRSQSFMCMMRTTFGNPHYLNDVMENYYRFVGEGNRERIQNRSTAYPVLNRIVAPTGADEPFYYSIETHYGASDHEVFNDWGVQVPGIMMITWPDRWYHTSGDHVDKTDPTQLKRVAAIGAAAAYTIASADDEMAIRIASETAGNGAQRVGHQLARGLAEMELATADTLAGAYKSAREHIEAAVINEKDTLETVNELASDKARVAAHVAALQKTAELTGAAQLAAVDAQMKALAARLKMAPVVLTPTELERAASAMVPKQTPKVTSDGYQGYRQFLTGVDVAKFRGLDTAEMSRLVNGRHSLLDIRKMLEAQAPVKTDLQQIIDYAGVLVKAGLIEMPAPAASGKKPARK